MYDSEPTYNLFIHRIYHNYNYDLCILKPLRVTILHGTMSTKETVKNAGNSTDSMIATKAPTKESLPLKKS